MRYVGICIRARRKGARGDSGPESAAPPRRLVVRFFVLRHAGYHVLPPPNVARGRRRPVRRTGGQPFADHAVRFRPGQRVPGGLGRRLPPGLVAGQRRRRRFRRLADLPRFRGRLFAQHVFDVGRLGPQHLAADVRYARTHFHRFLRNTRTERRRLFVRARVNTVTIIFVITNEESIRVRAGGGSKTDGGGVFIALREQAAIAIWGPGQV